MPATEYPLPSVSSSNPTPIYFELLPEEFVVGKTVYDDNGADYRLQAGGTGKKTWIIKYNGLTAAQAAILDAHMLSAFYSPDEGSAAGFNFRHHIGGDFWSSTAGTLFSNVHYSAGGYKTSHSKVFNHAREVILEKRP